MKLETILRELSRPKILFAAARVRLQNYSREEDLKRLLGVKNQPGSRKAIAALLTRETELETARKNGNAAYDMKLHIHVMTALLQELYLIPKSGFKP